MGQYCSNLGPEGVDRYVLVQRLGKFVLLGAGLYSIDWSSDILAVVSYFQSSSWMFGSIGVAILIVNPSLVWLYMVKNDGASGTIKSYLSFVLPWFVWTKAFEAVSTGKDGFEMAFITVAEAPAEAFPQGVLQAYSLMIGVFDEVADKVMLGVPKQILIQLSICISFASMAKSMTTFDFYGQQDISLFVWMRQLLHRFAQVVVRVVTIALFGALMRPQDIDLHQNVNYWLPCLLMFGFTSNLAIMRYWVPHIEMPYLWALFCMLGAPPLFLTIFDDTRTPLVCLRFVEFLLMTLIFLGDQQHTALSRCRVLVYLAIASVGLLILTTLFIALEDKCGDQKYVLLGARKTHNDALIQAVTDEDVFLVRTLAKLADCNATDDKGETPVCAANSSRIMEVLISTCSVDWRTDEHKRKVLAVFAGDDLGMAKVVAASIDVNADLTSEGLTPVSSAKSVAIMKILISTRKVDWQKDEHKRKILQVFAGEDLDMVQVVMAATSIDVNAALNTEGETPVSVAKSPEIMKVLAPLGIDWFQSAHQSVWPQFALECGLQLKGIISSDGETLKVWDLPSGKFFALQGPYNAVTLAAVGTDKVISGRIASAAMDVWDLPSGKRLAPLEGHNDKVSGRNDTVSALVAMGADQVVSGSTDCTLKLWDLPAGKCLKTLSRHSGPVLALAAMGTDQVISGSKDKALKLWDLPAGKCLKTLKGHTGEVCALATMGADQVVSGSSDNTLILWGLPSGTPLKTFKGHTALVSALVAMGTDQVVSGSSDNTLKVWDLPSGKCLKTLEGHTREVSALVAMGTDQVVSGSGDHTLKVWDLPSGKCLKTLEDARAVITLAAIGSVS